MTETERVARWLHRTYGDPAKPWTSCMGKAAEVVALIEKARDAAKPNACQEP